MRRRGSITVGAVVLAWSAWALVAPTAHATSTGHEHRAGPATSRTTLITGDVVRVTSGAGPTRVGVLPRVSDGIAAHFTTTRLDGRTYVIPAVASRYLGILDRSLFEVGPKAGAGPKDVTLSVQSGTSPTVPGLTVTSRSAGAWRGHFTAAGARQFGAALTEQWRTDAAAHRVSRTLFGGVTRMVRPATQAALQTPVQPLFPQQTLSITVLGRNGKPVDFADVVLTNVSEGRSKYSNEVLAVGGVTKISVPIGTYSGLATVESYSKSKVTVYLVPVEEIEVGSGGGTMVFDTRLATMKPAVHTPKPASLTELSLEWWRLSGQNTGAATGIAFSGSNVAVRVAPSAPATKGTLNWLTAWKLAGSPGNDLPFTYDLAFRDTGRVPADQDRTVATADLARIDARYYTDDPSRTTGFGRGVFYPSFQDGFGFGLELQPAALARTEYVAAPSDALWGTGYFALAGGFEDDDQTELDVDDSLRSYQAGSTYDADWLRGPLGPGISPPASTDDLYYGCGYCRDATSMIIGMAPVADSTLGHFGYFFSFGEGPSTTRFRLYRDGTLIDDQDDSSGDLVDVDPGTATYRAIVDTRRGAAGFGTSTTARTDLTFVSSAVSGPAAPDTWRCLADEEGDDGVASVEADSGCSVLPVLVSHVPLPTDLVSTMPLGSVPMDFTVDHAVGAADPEITSVTVELTHDGGKTYVAMPVTQTSTHHYRTTLRNPPGAKGRAVGFRLTATDAAGGRLVQTTQSAYFAAQS